MNKAVFIDKDGTLIKNIPHNVKPELVEFEDGAFESLLKLQKIGYKLIIISNHPYYLHGYIKYFYIYSSQSFQMIIWIEAR